MTTHDWVSVGRYSDYLSAEVVSGRLSREGVTNRIWRPQRSAGECYIWVPPELVDEAKRILAEPPISEAALTRLALKEPPPDDFDLSRASRVDAYSEPEGTRVTSPALAHLAPLGYRGPLLWTHAVLAFLSLLAYTSRSNVANLGLATFSGLGLVLGALPALFPYLISAMTSGAWVPKPRWRLYAFVTVLTTSGLAAALLTAAGTGIHLDGWELFGVYVLQSFLYMGAVGGLLLDRR
jgi:hypothetical protein